MGVEDCVSVPRGEDGCRRLRVCAKGEGGYR